MTRLNIECENTYKTAPKVDVVKVAEDIFKYFMSVDEISQNSCLAQYSYSSVSFDFLLCDGEKTHEINREYRNKDLPADIITFAVFADSAEDERFILEGEVNLGEIIIALDQIELSAKEKGVDFVNEFVFFISHGILHLLGFDHQTEKEYNFVVENQIRALKSIGMKYDKI